MNIFWEHEVDCAGGKGSSHGQPHTHPHPHPHFHAHSQLELHSLIPMPSTNPHRSTANAEVFNVFVCPCQFHGFCRIFSSSLEFWTGVGAARLWKWSCNAREQWIACWLFHLGLVFCLQCFVCKSLKLHIMASLAVSSSWPQTEPTDMHRATGQMGKRATGQPGNWASGQPKHTIAGRRWRPQMANGEWRNEWKAIGWELATTDRKFIRAMFSGGLAAAVDVSVGCPEKKKRSTGKPKTKPKFNWHLFRKCYEHILPKKNKKVKSCLRGWTGFTQQFKTYVLRSQKLEQIFSKE